MYKQKCSTLMNTYSYKIHKSMTAKSTGSIGQHRQLYKLHPFLIHVHDKFKLCYITTVPLYKGCGLVLVV
jgi:hypothetical protein